MKKEDFVKLGLTEEQAEKAATASAEELKGFIPKDRFDEVNTAKKQLETEISTRDKQIESLKRVDAEGLKAEIEKLQGENKAAQEKHEADLKQVKIENAVEKALLGAKAKNIKAVKALLDLTSAELDGDSIKGLDKQIKSLQDDETSKFLFGEATITGTSPANGSGGAGTGGIKNPWAKETFNLTEQGRIMQENPELAKQLQSKK